MRSVDAVAILVLRASGWSAAIGLALALACSPIARIATATIAARALRARRLFGIGAASIAIMHAILAALAYLPIDDLAASVARIAWLRSGALALALLLPLLATSFPPITRALRVPPATWKPLHRLSYAALFLVLHHVALGPFAPRSWLVTFASLVTIIFAARVVARRRDRSVAKL